MSLNIKLTSYLNPPTKAYLNIKLLFTIHIKLNI